tara:strand:+ start:297 stop:1301 length:1005 start_codon:yes stop_codon:yes gene_type:complete
MKTVNVIDKNPDGTFVFGDGQLTGWAFDSTCPPAGKERTIRNAILSMLRAQVDGDHALAKKILNIPVNGKTVAGAICEGITLYAMSSHSQKVAVKAVEEVHEESARTGRMADGRAVISVEKTNILIENNCRRFGFRPRLIEHHQNGRPAKVWIWNEEDTGKLLVFIGVEVLENGDRMVLDKLPRWSLPGGRPEYAEQSSYGDSRLPKVSPSPAVADLYKDCATPPPMGQQLEADLKAREVKATTRGTYDPNNGSYSPAPEARKRDPFKSGGPWIKRTLGEQLTIGTARMGKNGTRGCELCLDNILGKEKFVKGTTGAKRAHKTCFDTRAKHVHA